MPPKQIQGQMAGRHRERNARRGRPAWAGAACLALASVNAAGAARAAADPLAEVIVLAQRRPMELQEVPLALSALSGDGLEARGIGDVRALAGRVPMLGFQESVGAPTATFRIRRVGNIGNIPTFEPAVGYFVDGAYRSRSLFAAGPLMRHLFDAVPEKCRFLHQASSADLIAPLKAELRPGDIVLIKGSLGSRMGLIVEALLAAESAS